MGRRETDFGDGKSPNSRPANRKSAGKGEFVDKPLFLLMVLIMHISSFANDLSVSFSVSGGFYDHPFSLSLSCPEGYIIHYTTNGNEPSSSDYQYVSPLTLGKNLFSRSNIYTIQTCADESWFIPDTIQKCIVIRAAVFDSEGNRKGPVVTNSYFIKALGIDFHGLSVVSLCSDTLSLFGYENGILIPGATRNNYEQHGREWERQCNFEFYEAKGNNGVNQQAGLRIHGAITRLGIQKGFKLYARKEYGVKRFQYNFFNTSINSYKRLVLKPVGDGKIRDYICSRIAENLNLEVPNSRLVVLFLNGEYWGLYYLKERPDAHFIQDHYGINKNDVNVIESWSGAVADGNNISFMMMMQWIMNANLSTAEEYEHICSIIDVDCFIDYYCLQLFIANSDWPNNNMRCWQANKTKWRWIFYDGDNSLDYSVNMLNNTLLSNNNKDISSILFSKLLTNQDFRDRFYKRFGELLTHELHPNHTRQYYEECVTTIRKGLDSHFQRFGYKTTIEEFDFLNYYVDSFLSFRVINAASMVYQLYYYNGWEFHQSKSKVHSHFKYKPNSSRPTFLLRMARQFKDWTYVKLYFSYERYRVSEFIKSTKLYKFLKSK